MSDSRTFVIVGAGLAGATAADTLRDEGFEGRIVLIGEEAARPYERPPLSKGYLQGSTAVDGLFVHDESHYVANEIDLRRSTKVISIDVSAQAVELDSGARVAFDSLLLATGSAPRRLTVPGAELTGVHYLRTLADSDALRGAVKGASRVIVIGAGWIGCEVAASARQLGAEVAMVGPGHLPLERVLGRELGEFYRDVHLSHGVELHIGSGVEELQGKDRVDAVRLADGTVIEGDVVVVGIGITPRAELAEAAGIPVDGGVLTNEYLETDVPGIFAAGDVANAWHPLLARRLRLDHWSAAINQGPAAARNMLGARTAYERVPYFFSDQYDVGMEHSGLATEWDEVVFRGEKASGEFIAFWLKDGRVAAGMNVNVSDVADPIATLVASRQVVDRARLIDSSVDLSSLLQA